MDSILCTGCKFNSSTYAENEANRWKFLEEMDPATTNNPGLLLRSPAPVVTMTSVYILFVCLIGPFLMRNRQPYQLKSLIRFYNLLMVFLAGILLYKIYDAVGSLGAFIDPEKTFSLDDGSGTKIYQMSNFIIIVRLSEYLDTIFFTLRKKQNQVTFLHVFHHAFVPMYAYWILRTAPVRFNVFIILINSAIHVLMYSYYLLATYQAPREPGKAQPKQSLLMKIVTKILLFKKYMTQLQILQFVTLAIYAIWAIFQRDRCGIPWTYIIANMLLAFGFLGLFLHFYLNVYKTGLASAKLKREQKNN